MRIDPTVIHEAIDKTGCSSPDEFGWKFIGKSGTTVRNYLNGKTVPAVTTLMVVKKITGRALDDMILTEARIAA